MPNKSVAWVKCIEEQDATGDVAKAYAHVAGPDGVVENLYKAMSLTPGVIKPADDHYLALLHNKSSPLEPWLSELIATYVSILCGSEYAALNHGENFEHHYGNRQESSTILRSLYDSEPKVKGLPAATCVAIDFTRKLSLSPQQISSTDIDQLRAVGFCDTSISYIAQIAASFAYWARITNALGIELGDTIGLTGKPTEA